MQANIFAAATCVLVLDFYLTQAASLRLKSNRAATLSAAASAIAVGTLCGCARAAGCAGRRPQSPSPPSAAILEPLWYGESSLELLTILGGLLLVAATACTSLDCDALLEPKTVGRQLGPRR